MKNEILEEVFEPEMYTYEDLTNIDDKNRYEIFDGELYMMSAPTVKHQVIAGEIFVQFNNFFNGKKCRPFISPVDVLLDGKGKNSKNVVQPDVLVVCEPNKIKDQIDGVPDLVVEVQSQSTARYDIINKLELYQKYGVREYWQVNIRDGLVYVHVLDNKKLYTLKKVYRIEEKIKSDIFTGLEISLESAFDNNKDLFADDIKNYWNYKNKDLIKKSKKN